jgi:hypothetical protein
MEYNKLFEDTTLSFIAGKYITLDTLTPVLNHLNRNNNLSVIGNSVNNLPIYQFQIGSGSIKILMWSQMHGNESTTTKGLIDFLNFLNSKNKQAQEFMSKFTLCILPMLNPDGALLHTRENFNKVDLNRDSQNLTQSESVLLRKTFEEFKPDFCYNLHDQRTIFGVESSLLPATMSFLAPSFNENRDINSNRQLAINLIACINEELQKFIPNQVGLFDDSFNINCIGDTFQYLGVPTILFEAGHYQDDYDREQTRKYVFIALISSLKAIYDGKLNNDLTEIYFKIPSNFIVFYDIIIRNVLINYENKKTITNIAIQYKEEIVNNKIAFVAYYAEIGDLDNKKGHLEYDCANISTNEIILSNVEIGNLANLSVNNSFIFVNGIKK